MEPSPKLRGAFGKDTAIWMSANSNVILQNDREIQEK
jgi:hypothetical protein